MSTPLPDYVGEIQLKTKSPNTEMLSTKVVEKENFDYWINIKLERDVLHKQSAWALQRQKETLPFHVAQQIESIPRMFSR